MVHFLVGFPMLFSYDLFCNELVFAFNSNYIFTDSRFFVLHNTNFVPNLSDLEELYV